MPWPPRASFYVLALYLYLSSTSSPESEDRLSGLPTPYLLPVYNAREACGSAETWHRLQLSSCSAGAFAGQHGTKVSPDLSLAPSLLLLPPPLSHTHTHSYTHTQ